MNYWWMIKDRGCILKPRHLPKVVAVWACPGAQSIGRAWPWRLFWRQASGTRPWGPVGGRHWRHVLFRCALWISLNLFEAWVMAWLKITRGSRGKIPSCHFMPFHATIPYPVRKNELLNQGLDSDQPQERQCKICRGFFSQGFIHVNFWFTFGIDIIVNVNGTLMFI
jgi:hypothetical protein